MPVPTVESVMREAMHAALDQLHVAQQRIAALEAQLKAAREEIRRYVGAKMGDE
jgi:outer membrane protein TolC